MCRYLVVGHSKQHGKHFQPVVFHEYGEKAVAWPQMCGNEQNFPVDIHLVAVAFQKPDQGLNGTVNRVTHAESQQHCGAEVARVYQSTQQA